MSLPSNGITQEVIREMMPPYYLSPDLLEAMFAAMPPPPPDASATWRQARITRLMQEFSTLMPANAAQARVVSQILIMRGLADAIAARAFAPELTALQMCRGGGALAGLGRRGAGGGGSRGGAAGWGRRGAEVGVVAQPGAWVDNAEPAAGWRQGAPGGEVGDAD